MAEKDPGDDGPSLELPSFGLRRKKRASAPEPGPAEPDPPAGERVETPGAESEPVEMSDPAQDQADEPTASPVITGQPAAILTGLIVGVVLVGLAWGSLGLCEVAGGTSSCGRPGFFVLIAILALLVVVGRALLRRLGVRDAGSTSLLGVGVVAFVLLLFLSEQLFEWWTALVVPAVTMASFALAQWVSTVHVDLPEDDRHR